MNNLMRVDPLHELEEMNQRLSRFFGANDLAPFWRGEREDVKIADWRPAVDIEETEEAYLIKVELPEVRKEDVKVSVQNGILTLQGERRMEKEKKDRKVHRVERFYGNFVRSFALPDEVEAQDVSAEFKDGMLYVRMGKSEKAKPRSIEVKVG
jgi:HSP20 family protein